MYSHDEAINHTLQMQVRREVEKLKGNDSTSGCTLHSQCNDQVGLYNCHEAGSRVNLAGGK
jgi:hypothetical protein